MMKDLTKDKTGQTVAEHIVEFLRHRGVKHVFGLCGHTNIAVLSALEKSEIDFVTVRHEQIASHAADAYARVTGKASVVLSHLSPGLTNCATGGGKRCFGLYSNGGNRRRCSNSLLW